MSHPTESRLPRSNSSASLRSINNVVTSPEVATTKIAQRTSVLGPQRKTALPVGTTKLARAAQSKRKSFTGASTGVVGPTAPEVTTAAAPPTQTQTCVNPSASAASVSQIPRSAIPRPPTMTNLVAAAAAASTTAATTATKPASQPSTISTGVNAATLAALTGTAAGGASTRVLRNRTLSRPASIAVMPSTSGLPRSASQHNLGLKAPDKASIPLKLEKDKQKHKHKVADKEKDKPLVGAKRVPLPGPTPAVKDDSAKSALHGITKPRPASMIEKSPVPGAGGTKATPPLAASGLRVPLPRIQLTDDAVRNVESPTPLPGSLAASKNRTKSVSPPPALVLGQPKPIPSPAPAPATATATPGSTISSKLKVKAGMTPARPARALRRILPETPALRTLLNRERNRPRLPSVGGDDDARLDQSLLSSLTEADISLASSTSFSQLTPPSHRAGRSSMGGNTSRDRSYHVLDPDSSVASRSSNRNGTTDNGAHAASSHQAHTLLRAELSTVQAERKALEARVASLIQEEERLKGIVDTAMRDREHAMVIAEEAEAQRDTLRWEGVMASVEEGMEENMAMKSTISAMRALVEVW